MEPLFNFVWLLVALACVCVWFKQGRRDSDGKRASLVGLAMLVLILFPVISVSDDLWSLQNPAEADSCQRRDHRDISPQSHFPAMVFLPEAIGTQINFGMPRVVEQPSAELIAFLTPVLGPIQNRPPPVL